MSSKYILMIAIDVLTEELYAVMVEQNLLIWE